FTLCGSVEVLVATAAPRAGSSRTVAASQDDTSVETSVFCAPDCAAAQADQNQPGDLREDPGKIMLAFSVRDSGIGIPKDARGKLFRSFTQVDSSTTRKYGGTGLGLSICNLLVELMGGSIRVSSVPGIGSTFSFTLPLEKPPRQSPGSDRSRDPSDGGGPAPAGAGGVDDKRAPGEKFPVRILLAEDNATNVMVATGMLAKLRFTDVSVVQNGEQAVAAVRARNSAAGPRAGGGPGSGGLAPPPEGPRAGGRVDLVLMDMQMPIMSGVTATMTIRGDASIDQPVILALTANAMDADRQTCMDAGMDGFLAKPIKLAELESMLEMHARIITGRGGRP
ncbi:MAG: histidine kinase-like ATPase, partial [Olpidium bornovanus]